MIAKPVEVGMIFSRCNTDESEIVIPDYNLVIRLRPTQRDQLARELTEQHFQAISRLRRSA